MYSNNVKHVHKCSESHVITLVYMGEEFLLKIGIGFKQVQICQYSFMYHLVLTLHGWQRDKLNVTHNKYHISYSVEHSKHTRVQTAPGFCILRAFTTWNTSTTPSVLHFSIVVAMAQNMPERLTVSLHV